MGRREGARVACILAVVLLAAPGCVSKKMFRGNLEDTDGRVVAVESAIEANGRAIKDLKMATDQKLSAVESKANSAAQSANQAMSKAQSAESAAKGKLIWSVTLTDDRVKFDFGRASLTSAGIGALDKLVQQVKAYGKALYLEVEGHTDSVGDKMNNHRLGEMRAVAVRNYLNEKGGIPLHAMNTISYGEDRPIADNSSEAGRSQNRRVVIRVLE